VVGMVVAVAEGGLATMEAVARVAGGLVAVQEAEGSEAWELGAESGVVVRAGAVAQVQGGLAVVGEEDSEGLMAKAVDSPWGNEAELGRECQWARVRPPVSGPG